jgi:LuxR family transcriptional regulator, quorum-sensing system regulator BjaR1
MECAEGLETVAFDFIDRLTGVEDKAVLLQTLFTGLSQFGFNSFLIAGLPARANEFERGTLLNGWPAGWYSRYTDQGYYDKDPIAIHARNTIDPFFWSEVDRDHAPASLPSRIMNEAAEFGMDDGLLVPVYGINGEQFCVTMAGHDIDRRERVKQAIHLMAFYALSQVQKFALLKPQKTAATVSLTARETECLRWVAAGKSDWDISEILGISTHTANSHVRRASAKLDAVNRTHAVVKALQQQFITL